MLFVIPFSLLWSTEINHFICLPTRLSTLSLTPVLALFHHSSFSYHIIDHLRSIHFVSFSPLPSFPLSSVFLLPCLRVLSSKALTCQRHFTRNPSTVQTHTHIHWRSVTPVQCKIYPDVISADRDIDRQQYSHDRNDSPSSLPLCVRMCTAYD